MTSVVKAGRPTARPRAGCEGIVALPARLERWQLELARRPALVEAWLEAHGSPLNLLDPAPMARNAGELRRVADRFGVDFKIYFARKANKALAFVDEATRLGLGVDLASERELTQVLERGVPAGELVMTAAVKPRSLLDLCLSSGTTIVIDNADELRLVSSLAHDARRTASIALRLTPSLGDDRLPSRFGLALDEAIALVDRHWPFNTESRLTIDGVHFHIDGYDAAERVGAIGDSLALVDALRERGHRPSFVDIGGGIPVNYLRSAHQWERFWIEHRKGLLGERAPLTFAGHGLGLAVHRGEIVGSPSVYPYYGGRTRADWLTEVLAGRVESRGTAGSVADAVRERGLQLRCEPGRALLDGCGLTAARVVHRKQRRDGTWLIGVEMNRTQCRSTSDDFLVDPLLLRAERGVSAGAFGSTPASSIEGYLVGAYCIEQELLTWRRLRFPLGVEVGDIVVLPNTAGYLMHILESSSHQMPLARNLVVGAGREPSLDPIDAQEPA